MMITESLTGTLIVVFYKEICVSKFQMHTTFDKLSEPMGFDYTETIDAARFLPNRV